MTSTLLSFGTTEIVLVSVFGAIGLAILVYLCCIPMKTYLTVIFAGCYIPSYKLISLKSRKLDVKTVASAYIMAKKSKIDIKLSEIEAIVLAGGNPVNVVKAYNLANKSGIKIDFQRISALEIASKDVLSVVQNAISTRVVKVENIKGFTQNNVELVVMAEVSVKANLHKYLEGSGIDDMKSNITAWLLENISRAKDYRNILHEPNKSLLYNIDFRVLTKNSRFDIFDINIVAVDIGRDINAENEIKSVEKEKLYAQIEAERRKSAEEIRELQMRTKTEEMKSAVLQAEAEVPQAISQAIKEGRFSIMDYYKLMNLQADTALRRAIINDNKKAFDDGGDLY